MKIDQVGKPSSLREDRQDNYKAALIELVETRKKYKQALSQLFIADRLVNEARRIMTAYPPVPVRPHPRPKHHGQSEESACLILSDIHFGKEVKPQQTLGFGHYNFFVACDELYFLEERIRSILVNQVTSYIDELVIFMLGDIAEGSLGHAKEVTQAMTRFDQFYAASLVLAQFIRNLAQDVKKVRIYSCVGNHGRNPDQRKMPTENRYSNLDHYIYAMVKVLLANQPNVEFNLDYQPYIYADVRGTKFLGLHGDNLKGGDKQMGVPIHAIARQINCLTQLFEARGREAPHYWLMGDKHKNIVLPTVKGDWLVNGSFTGDDNFSLSIPASAEPFQRFFGVHDKYRYSWEYKIKLRHAPPNKSLPYDLPPELLEVIV